MNQINDPCLSKRSGAISGGNIRAGLKAPTTGGGLLLLRPAWVNTLHVSPAVVRCGGAPDLKTMGVMPPSWQSYRKLALIAPEQNRLLEITDNLRVWNSSVVFSL